MHDNHQEPRLSLYLAEYEKLKDEQIARIGFRDNLVYATLIAIGGILSFALADPGHFYALLILPLATFVLGWIYLSNDYKITALGAYMRGRLTRHIRAVMGDPDQALLEWEHMYKLEPRRLERKLLQLFVNEALFAGSGVAAILVYLTQAASIAPALRWLAGVQLWAMLVLAVEIIINADFRLRR